MLGRKNIRNAAMLKPDVAKSGCSTLDNTGKHAYFNGKCVSCHKPKR